MRMKEIKLKDQDISTRIKSIEDGILRTGPYVLRIGVSRWCNYNCVMCWNYSPHKKMARTAKWKKTKIGTKMALSAIEEASQLGCKMIFLTADGEPFTHPDIMRFIKKAKEQGMNIYLPTNLSLVMNIEDLAKHMRGQKNTIAVNLMAANAETYTKIHPNQNRRRFYDIINKIELLRSEGVPVRFIFVINQLNYQEIEQAFTLNKKLGTKLFLEMMAHMPGDGLDKLACDKSQRNKILTIARRMAEHYEFRSNSNVDSFILHLTYSNIGVKDINECVAGFFFSNIDELGDVYFCCAKQPGFLLGNLKKESFKNIWRSDRYQGMRTKLLNGEFRKECSSCLGGSSFKMGHLISLELLLKHFCV